MHPATETLADDTPIVILIPGISGSTKQHYVKNFVHAVSTKGWKTAVINHRGCNCPLEVLFHFKKH